MINTPYSAHFDDIYFAVEDGLAESRYVFLDKNNLPQGWQDRSYFTICETGFGTGLNFLCAWTLFEQTTQSHQHLHYISFEKFPLSANEIVTYLGHWSSEFDGRLEQMVRDYPLRVGGWHTLRVSDRVTLTLIFDDVNRAIAEMDHPVDVWFLDGHAPAKNPDMWSDHLFHHIGRLSAAGAHFATFTAAGFVRRGLEAVGYTVTKTRGFGRKRDMSVGVFVGDPAMKSLLPPRQNHKIAIIGGGIAGASLAAELTPRGCDVHIYEKKAIAHGGSGNKRGLYNPRFAALRGFESDFYAPAFAKAVKLFSSIEGIDHQRSGALHLVTDADKRKRFGQVVENWSWHADHMRFLDKDAASEQAGIRLAYDALFLPDAGVVCPMLVTQKLAQCATVHSEDVTVLNCTGSSWVVNGIEYDAVIIASGKDAARFPQTEHLVIQAVRGQISYMRTPRVLENLRSNLCYGGYATLNENGGMVVGSTFQHWLTDEDLREDDHRDVLQKLQDVTPPWNEEPVITGGRASFRAAAKDRIPLIGKVELDHGLGGLYISAAHGSHGLLSSQIAAQMIAGDILGDQPTLPRSVYARVSPHRFRG